MCTPALHGAYNMSKRFTISEEQIQPTVSAEGVRPTVRSHWLEEAARQFRAIANLPQGWDSYASPPPEVGKLEMGWRLLVCLCQARDLPKPHINPTPSGGVQLDWEEEHLYFEVEVVSESAATYLWVNDVAGVEETGTISEGDPLDAIIQFVRRVGRR